MSTSTTLPRSLVSFAVVLLLAACSGTAGTSDASDTPLTPSSDGAQATEPASDEEGSATGGSLCDLVPVDQVELALGGSTDGGVGKDSTLTGGQTCRFTADDEHVLDVSSSEQTHDEWLEAIETVGMNDEAVTGVGEEAYRAAETALGGPGARFTAWANGTEVGVTVYSDVDQETTFAAAQAVAEAVLAGAE
jgi:hypothetical protein